MKEFGRKYGDYFLYVGFLLLKLYLFSLATTTYFSFYMLIVSLGSAFLLSFWILSIAPKKRRWMLVGFSVLISFLIVSNGWYYRYFTDLLSVSLVIQLPQMDAVGGGMQDIIQWYDFLFFLDALIILVFLVINRKKTIPSYSRKSRITAPLAALAAGLVLFFTPLLLTRDGELIEPNPISNLKNYYQTGMIGYHAVDIVNEMDEAWFEDAELSAEEKEEILSFQEEKQQAQKTEEVDELPNIIVVQLESFQSSVIGQEIDGQVVTPNLNEFKDESIYFSNFYHQTHEGRTSDAEFIINTSFYPLKSGSVYTRYPGHSFGSLPEELSNEGYETAAFHAFRPNFWNRDQMYENFGFDEFYSIDDFPDEREIGLTLNDKDFFLTGVEKMSGMEEPFYSFMVALTSHTPYSFPDDMKTLDFGLFDEEILRNYYHNVHYVDSAFGAMKEKLIEEELWDRSMIVVYGDHDSALFKEDREMAQYENAETAVDYFELGRKVPLFIKPASSEEGRIVEKSGGQIDVAPTILSLAGIQPDFMMGTSLLSEEKGVTAFRDGSFVYDGYYYESNLWNESGNGTCYSLETEQKVETDRCAAMVKEAEKQLQLSDLIIKKNGLKQLE
ncbi:LTA synthase family protein [Jeotgalibacillus sp. ET6]|uniref:LTA synthase family protein n=1 Tax=Jeotgalibacillus sp. ET6 TaxID=3037260 RepID=UPI002418B364|nr:LTA synthase family protein [Jeotgalibacillus sp. ET6]MDG5471946.1 LTA synthase family protein [Jeotgalibacillus sp. ET6]